MHGFGRDYHRVLIEIWSLQLGGSFSGVVWCHDNAYSTQKPTRDWPLRPSTYSAVQRPAIIRG